MKHLLSVFFLVLVASIGYSQCYPSAVSGPTYGQIGQPLTFTNPVSGGRWSVTDATIAAINPSTGVLYASNSGVVYAQYNMPGACILFSSNHVVNITRGIYLPDSIEVGRSITAYDSVTSTATWSSSDSNIARVHPSTGVVTGIARGRADISCTFTGGGMTFTVRKQILITSGQYGRRRLYTGDTTTRRQLLAGGTWSSNDTNVIWIDATTGLMQGRNPGRAIVTVQNIVAGIGCTSFDTLTVGRGLNNSRTLCQDDSIQFIDSASGGLWASSDTSVASVSGAGWVVAGAAGWTAISYTVTTLGRTFVISDSLLVNPAPSITHIAPVSLCNFTTTTVSMLAGSTFTVGFSDPSLVRLTSMGGISSMRWVSVPTSTILTYTDRTCPHVWDTTTVTVYPEPAAGTILGGNVSICPSDTIQFTITGVSGGSWMAGSSRVYINSTGLAHVIRPFYDTTGLYIYHNITDAHGCTNSTSTTFTQLPAVLGGSILGAGTINMGIIGNFSTDGRGTSGSWAVTPSTIGTISPTGQFTPFTTGTATIKHYVSTVCGNDSAIRTITVGPPAFGATCSFFTGFVNAYCSAPQFGISCIPHSAPFKLKTYYGDGTFDTVTIAANSSIAMSYYSHVYSGTGTYSIKQILYIGSWAADSVDFSYTHVSCNNIYLNFFEDVDHSCSYNPSIDRTSLVPILIKVDSNGIAVDTLSITSGLYYTETGRPGDIYAFRIINGAVSISCPSTGVVYDTIRSGSLTATTRNVPFTCTAGGFDMIQYSTATTGRHHQVITIDVGNLFCASEDGTLQVDIDPRYAFQLAAPYPDAISGSRLTWNFTGISSVTGVTPQVVIDIETPGTSATWLAPGTPVPTHIRITPVHTGDVDTNNNVIQRWDTVKSSYDPNRITVNPGGNVIGGTNLHYMIEFENDGNDTARNIYVMDTLPDYLDVNSLRIVMATARMNTQIIRSGGHNIIKFDFPGINLPDSSSHNLCRGRVMFNLRTLYGLAEGISIINHAGIFFDDNPVILTDTAYNSILIPAITAATTCHDTICRGGSVHALASAHTTGTTHFQWFFNGSATGTDSLGYTNSIPVAGDSLRVMMTTIMDDTVHSYSNWMHLTERALPNAGIISGSASVCPASTIALTNSIPGGSWTLSNTHATISSSGMLTGTTPGTDTAIYTVTNICYPNSSIYPVTISSLPDAGIISGPSAVCLAGTVTLAPTVSGGIWGNTSGRVTITAGLVTGNLPGLDTITYRLSNFCGSDTSVFAISIDTVLRPAITGLPSYICAGSSIVTSCTPSGGTWTMSNSRATVASGTITGTTAGTDTLAYTVMNACGTRATTATFMVYTVVTPAVTAAATTSGSICEGSSITLNATGTNTGSSPLYYWEHGGSIIGTGSSLTYTPTVGDAVVCHMVSNAICRTADTVASALMAISVNPAVHPTMTIVASPSDTLAYAGQLISLYSTTTYGGSSPAFQWYLNGVAVAGATAVSYSLNAMPGDSVSCTMTSDVPCAAETLIHSNTVQLRSNTTGVQTTGSFSGLNMYPIPNKGRFTLSGLLANKNGEPATLEVTEITGKTIYTTELQQQNGAINQTIDMQGTLAPGNYLLRIVQGENYAVLHLVID